MGGKFKPGQSGNPNGRPKGKKNLTTSEVKELVLGLLRKEFSLTKISNDLKELNANQRLNFFLRLTSSVLPKEQELKIDYDKLTPEQLDYIIEKIVNESK